MNWAAIGATGSGVGPIGLQTYINAPEKMIRDFTLSFRWRSLWTFGALSPRGKAFYGLPGGLFVPVTVADRRHQGYILVSV